MARRSAALAALALSSLAACADPISSGSSVTPGAVRYNKSGDGIPEVATAKTNKVEPAGVDRGRYNITFRYLGSTDPKYQAVFDMARERWERIIIADEPSVSGTLPTQLCGGGAPAFTGTIDDILIDVILTPIDGPGRVLGSAGPCFANDNNLSLHGTMRFDTADIDTFLARGLLDEIIVHEMGHVLGIGTLWNFRRTLRTPAPDFRFLGKKANVAYADIGGQGLLPIEDMFGPGTRGGHWRESTLDNELMTGFIESNNTNPLSRITAGSMRDLGYGSAMTAEDYQLPAPVVTTAAGATGGTSSVEDVDIANGEELLELQATVQRADP